MGSLSTRLPQEAAALEAGALHKCRHQEHACGMRGERQKGRAHIFVHALQNWCPWSTSSGVELMRRQGLDVVALRSKAE